MRILILSNEVWNDNINGNNVTTNWFKGMEAEIACIYTSSNEPLNACCKRYYQVTDRMMLKSIFKKTKAGKALPVREYNIESKNPIAEVEPKKLYKMLKSVSGPFLRFVREMLWLCGRYDTLGMKSFINDFKPDVVFSERMATCKMLRLEKIVGTLTEAPMFAFTGDDEYSLKQLSFSPFFWINRFMIRKRLKENVKKYRIYYTLSEEQKHYYERAFGCKCKLLYKCGELEHEEKNNWTHEPIRLIYAGKLYCNRWKMLGDIANELREINKDSVKMVMDIYTKDRLTDRQMNLLNDGKSSFVQGGVEPNVLVEKYRQADIALHVEALDLKNRLLTRYSFSTKIIDCIFSGCAVMAYCWDKHSGLTYLKKQDAAICISNKDELHETIRLLVNRPEIINQYAKKAINCGNKYHNRIVVQRELLNDFKEGIKNDEDPPN